MSTDLLSTVVTLGVFGAIGWSLAQRWRLPVARGTWLLLVLVMFGSPFVGTNTDVICFNGIGICVSLNRALTSSVAGTLVGLLVRVWASRQSGQP